MINLLKSSAPETARGVSVGLQAHASLSRYFSPNLAEELASELATFDVNAKRVELSSLFTDIAGFTSLAESLEPSALAQLLNAYIGGMMETVFAEGGTVAKIVGDAIHVLFGATRPQPDHAARAVACALALDAFAESFRADACQRGIALGVTRIGVHSGTALVGNFGGGRFFDYTAYGDTINIAARLESLNKQIGTRICVSGATAERVPDFKGRQVGDVVLRGRSEPIRVFEMRRQGAGGAPFESYAAAFERLARQDADALPALAALVGAHANDALASFHLKRLLNGKSGALITMD